MKRINRKTAKTIYKGVLTIIGTLSFVSLFGEMTPEAEAFFTEWVGGIGCTAVLFMSKIIAGFITVVAMSRADQLDEELKSITL